ncbi:MAG: universal stress protein [Bacteroidia bacterium]|nr:MAG: universal stress protein [Bacteroidia bacterium]
MMETGQADIRQSDAILVPVDFTDVSEYAIDHAMALAKIFEYRIYLLHVISKRQKGTDKEKAAEERLIRTSSELIKEGKVRVTHMVRDGNVFKTINSMADKIRASFIVMGVHGRKGIQHLTRTYPYKVACRASVPVLVVKDKHDHVGFQNIVVPVDFSRRSIQKITQAIRFAKVFAARVRVFGFLSSENKAKIINKEALLKSVNDIFQEKDVPVTTDLVVDPGSAWPDALLTFANSVNADLIMIVAEWGGRIQDIFSSNHTERILDKSDIPILTIMPCAEDLESEATTSKRLLVTPFIDPFGLIVKPGNM